MPAAEDRSSIMRAVKGRNTGPEMTVRRLLHDLGYRYRLHRSDLPGKPDLAFPSRRKVVFVHGCFWHGHSCARGARVPKTNSSYWTAKIAGNAARDVLNRARLEGMGWEVLSVWECELKDPARLEAFLTRFLESASAKR